MYIYLLVPWGQKLLIILHFPSPNINWNLFQTISLHTISRQYLWKTASSSSFLKNDIDEAIFLSYSLYTDICLRCQRNFMLHKKTFYTHKINCLVETKQNCFILHASTIFLLMKIRRHINALNNSYFLIKKMVFVIFFSNKLVHSSRRNKTCYYFYHYFYTIS